MYNYIFGTYQKVMLKKGLLKGYANTLNFVLRFVDLFLIFACGAISYLYSPAFETYTAQDIQGLPVHYLKAIFISVVITALILPMFNIYRVWRGTSTLTEIKHLTMAWLLVGLLLTALAFITKSGADFSRQWIGVWFVSAWVSLIGLRVVMRLILRWMRSNGYNHRHIVIVGTGDQAAVVAERLKRSTWFGLDISALYGTHSDDLPSWLQNKRLINDVSELRSYIDGGNVDQVWISLPHSEESIIKEVITALDGSVVEIRYVPDIFEYQLMHHSLSEIAGVPVVNISYSAIDGANKLVKVIEDYLLAVFLLVLASPLMIVIAFGLN